MVTVDRYLSDFVVFPLSFFFARGRRSKEVVIVPWLLLSSGIFRLDVELL